MAELNSVVQIIVSCEGTVAYGKMSAGSGWFPARDSIEGGLPEGTILTNAHVVRGAKKGGVYIRVPAENSLNIPVYVHGISTDLDLAVLRLDHEELIQVKSLLKSKYGVFEIPTLKMGDSDKVHPQRFDSTEQIRPTVIARGYPLGNDFQSFTDGRVSSIKYAMEQLYLVHSASIEPGNSGGPLIHQSTNEALGINSMKIRNANSINMVIPINRIRRCLPELMNNSENIKSMKEMDDQLTLTKLLFSKKLGAEKPSSHQIKTTATLLRDVNVDVKKCASFWNQTSAGGYKKVNGIVSPVTMSDWFFQHVHEKEGAHAIFATTMKHLEDGNSASLKEMRKNGWSKYTCESCSVGECLHNRDEVMKMTPARVLHMPKLGFRYAHGTPAMLEYYKTPIGVKSGVIISKVYPNGLFDRSGVKEGDLVHSINIDGKLYQLNNHGQSWNETLSVNLKIKDIVHRTDFGKNITLHVINTNGEQVDRQVTYDVLAHDQRPEIRMLDNLADAKLQKQMVAFRGLALSPLRLNHAINFRKEKYLSQEHEYSFKVIVLDVENGSDAYHSQNIRPGHVLSKINDVRLVATDWTSFCDLLSSFENDPVKIQTEEQGMIIL